MSTPFPGSVVGGSAERIVSANLATVRDPTRNASVQQRIALVGIMLALAMVAMLYQVLNDNITQLETKRLANEQGVRARHACAMQPSRLERDQCLASLVQPSFDGGSAAQPVIDSNTVLAGR